MKSIPVKINILVVILLGISPTIIYSSNGQAISDAFGIRLGAIYDARTLPHIPDTDPHEEERFISFYRGPFRSASRVMPPAKSKHFSRYLVQYVKKDKRIYSIGAWGATTDRKHCLNIASGMLSNIKQKYAISSVKTYRHYDDTEISYTLTRDDREIKLSCRVANTRYYPKLVSEEILQIVYTDLSILRELFRAEQEKR